MPDLAANMVEPIRGFEMEGMMMRCSLFVPRLYNWCKSLGFEAGKMMPSRAFCSDESQGFPIILIAKHFGTFPFNHGRVGGIVATDRHGPHADHGQDLVIIQASHVGYDPATKTFGQYRRLQTADQSCSSNCGKIHHVMDWYQNEYHFAQENILLHKYEGQDCVIIDNQLLREDCDEGLLLKLDKLIATDSTGQRISLKHLSTSKIFAVSPSFTRATGDACFNGKEAAVIGNRLTRDMFYYRRNIQVMSEGDHQIEKNRLRRILFLPSLVCRDKRR